MNLILSTLKQATILIAIFLSFGILTSCEKVEDEQTPTTTNLNDSKVLTEIFVVQKADWQGNQSGIQTTFYCSLLDKSTTYKSVSVFIKTPMNHRNPEIWKELPFDKAYFKISNNEISIFRSSDWEAEECTFMIEVEMEDSKSLKRLKKEEGSIMDVEKQCCNKIINDTL